MSCFQEVSGECVLLDLKSENYFGLDEVPPDPVALAHLSRA